MILPAITTFLFLNRLRMFLEHGSLDYDVCDYLESKRPTTRTIYASWAEQLLLCGSDFNYHHEHHLYMSVPGSKLQLVHRELKEIEYDSENVRATYFQSFMEIWRHLGKI